MLCRYNMQGLEGKVRAVSQIDRGRAIPTPDRVTEETAASAAADQTTHPVPEKWCQQAGRYDVPLLSISPPTSSLDLDLPLHTEFNEFDILKQEHARIESEGEASAFFEGLTLSKLPLIQPKCL